MHRTSASGCSSCRAGFDSARILEVALTLDGGGGSNNSYSTGGMCADFRYRFMAEQAWNVYALAGLGFASIAAKDATDPEKKGRGLFRVGGGVERRFGAFAIEAELRLFGVAQNKDLAVQAPPTTNSELAHDGVSGASLTLAGSDYF